MRKGKGKNNGLLPNSLRIISSCLKTVSSNASNVASSVRSAGASVAATISAASSEDQKDQVNWAGFDRLELSPSAFKHVLLLGYQNGFQVFDVEDASNISELVSKRDGPVSFLQMQPLPALSDGREGFRKSHPLLVVVAGDDTISLNTNQNRNHSGGVVRNGNLEPQSRNSVHSPTTVQFYSLRSHCYVHVLRFRSAVFMIRCSARIVAVGLATQIYCFDALTLENKFSVLTYPVPQLAGQGSMGINVGYGPMAVGPRWLAYASNSPPVSNPGRLSPQNLSPSPGVSPSTSPGGSSLVARFAMEQLASGIVNLGDLGYKTWSKYCQELLPDGSNSPVSSNSIWKVGRLGGTEMDNAGMVVVKDFVSRAIISQIKAHTSPISALYFDPSGTLLVTASIYGNNINVFRIMPLCKSSGSGVQKFDANSSHVHLYKLHRGVTSAIIQDICFSSYSQWIAIVSSKGTCHIFVLSPFGGDAGFRILNSPGEEPALYPVLSLPWWTTSSCIATQQSFPPPAPIGLSVVSRIKYSSFGWLNTVNNNPASAAGKVFVPSGAVAAVFHNSLSHSLQHSNSRADSLEYLLVYTPSGHVVQHELRPSIGVEPSEGGPGMHPTSFQEEELRVKVEPVQWWDVCRRSDWLEREDSPFGTICERQDMTEIIQNKPGSASGYGLEFGVRDNKIMDGYCQKQPQEKSHFYLSNAEVQISALRLPIWQKSKICFYVMTCPQVNSFDSGEFEIEKLPVHEVEMRQKELLPLFDHFHSIKPNWTERILLGGRYPNPTLSGSHNAEETVICHSKPASLSSTESSDGGSSRRIENLFDFDQISCEKPATFLIPNDQERKDNFPEPSNEESFNILFTHSAHLKNDSQVNGCVSSALRNLGDGSNEGSPSLITAEDHEDQNTSSANITAKESSVLHHPVDLGQLFQEDHCNISEHNGCHGLAEAVTNEVDSSSGHCPRENRDNGEDDEMLGDIFSFSDEG
ncbi:hypothetical protein UlMin_031357 [Ulmus minor]